MLNKVRIEWIYENNPYPPIFDESVYQVEDKNDITIPSSRKSVSYDWHVRIKSEKGCISENFCKVNLYKTYMESGYFNKGYFDFESYKYLQHSYGI